MRRLIPDLLAGAGALSVAAGTLLLAGLGPALIVLGAEAILAAVVDARGGS